MTDTSLEQQYRAYLDVLNERRFPDLVRFVHDELTYNDRPLVRREYSELIERSVAAIPDLFFEIRTLVVSGDLVACRLWFDCTPVGEILGLAPTGRRVAYAEHVFYRFREGRIANVWSLIDRDSLARQLAGEAPPAEVRTPR